MISYLSMPHKYELYDRYKEEHQKYNQGFDSIVTLERFIQLWNALFPHYLLRPYLNVPGKCKTCYQIDSLKNQTNDWNVCEALRQCHLLHRGGLFMIERKQ
jgi:hypothetical protein